ncbi:MAG: GH116 family glycosyl hydrolase, partial [Armatimonadota bacterium]|nr:GH116 family glycosyl hydrolase [Armatimonadota bacterium]
MRTSFVTREGAPYVPLNYDLEFRGPVLLREALASSYNLVAVKVLDHVGVEEMARLTREGGGVVATGVTAAFLNSVARTQERVGRWSDLEVFEDFEGGTYARWEVTGSAFADRPHTGTTPGQQPVSGFLGRGLVNSFRPNDAAQGEMRSRPFTIRRRYIGFLIGGGAHPAETCLNLLVEGRVVRTATGKNTERLAPQAWDVADLRGKEAQLQIVDRRTDGWGHINVDHIVFADSPPDSLMRLESAFDHLAAAVGLPFERAEPFSAAGAAEVRAVDPLTSRGVKASWRVGGYTRLVGFKETAGWKTLAALPGGDPLVVMGPAGKATLVLALTSDVPLEWVERLLLAARGSALGKGEYFSPGVPEYGTLALAAASPSPTGRGGDSRTITARNWTDGTRLGQEFAASGSLGGGGSSLETPPGESVNAALSVPLIVAPGEERTATFVIAWHFPNVIRFGHRGNLYSRRFPNAVRAAHYVCRYLPALWERTLLYHQTFYQSNLPGEWLDACSSQSVIFRGPTVWWSEDGYFAGYEGAYGCCPLNCTHVWNYAQTHARLFPQLGRNMRVSDLLVYLHADGETAHRQHAPSRAFIDGQAATIVAAYREHQLSPDRRFLEQVWPGVRKATDWLIERIDSDHDGVPGGRQPNTYDCEVSGANTFIGSQYLAALAAAERMALAMGEADTGARWRQVREAGQRHQNERLWNGEYYFQIPDATPLRDYNTGCHADQLLGQWWAHQLGLGYLYPRERVRKALESVMAYNFRQRFAGFHQRPRRYVPDEEGGLLICTWPKGGRPQPFIEYADEVWTGIEYAVAGAMVYEGMIDAARRLVQTARG